MKVLIALVVALLALGHVQASADSVCISVTKGLPGCDYNKERLNCEKAQLTSVPAKHVKMGCESFNNVLLGFQDLAEVLKDPKQAQLFTALATVTKHTLEIIDMGSSTTLPQLSIPTPVEIILIKPSLKSMPFIENTGPLSSIRLRVDPDFDFQEKAFAPFKNLRKIVVYNKIYCDCRLRWIRERNLNTENTTCLDDNHHLSGKWLYRIPKTVLCDKDECDKKSHPAVCHEDAVCSNTLGSYICHCPLGFTGDGYTTCTDINECATTPQLCSAQASCVNTKGSFLCACKPGYYGNGAECHDYDECSLGLSMCDPKTSTCRNTPGGYACVCNKGAKKVGKLCEDQDECEDGSHTCKAKHMKCINTLGSFKCGCMDGFTENGSECVDIDECSTKKHNCSKYASCKNTAGSFTCACNAGYHGNGQVCYRDSEFSAVLRIIHKNPVLNFIWKRKLVLHALGAAGVLLLVVLVLMCLCIRSIKRRGRRKKYKRIPTDDEDHIYETVDKPRKVKKGIFRRVHKKTKPSAAAPKQQKATPVNPPEPDYLEPTPPPPAAPAPPPPPAAAPPPPPPPPPVKKPAA
ncbi:slit homolog 1 protein [Nematostella vectensis]|uniref:slit homolog 1 protein n=1 Tax=Nematostella vectensis TaxID=45351 RepID=UPI002076E77B|nr:slit homolog 1 protein [Nematostella vectensis]